MNEINLQKQIQDLTLNFFKKIKSNISQNENVFTIVVPEEYYHLFGKIPFSITFDSKTASNHSIELIAPGSKLLHQITNLCKTKGPISTGITDDLNNSIVTSNSKFGIRFFFNITYESVKYYSKISHIDFDINSSERIDISQNLIPAVDLNIGHLDFSNMPSLFLKSSKNIRKIFETNEKEFIKSISDKKDLETKNIQQEYDKMILEIESEIKENEQKNLTDPEKYKLNDES